MRKNYKLILWVVLVVMPLSVWGQKKLSIQERISKLEQQVSGNTVSSGGSQNFADLVIQIQQLQSQMANLQGRIEEQNYLIEELKKRQKVLYVDMDSRIAAIESGGSVQADPSSQSLIQNSESSSSSEMTGPDVTSGESVVSSPEVRKPVEANIQTTTMSGSDIQGANNQVSNPQANALYERAFGQLKAGRFTESARLFEDFVQQYPTHELTDNSYYWLGESHYVSRNYPLALAAFQSLEEKFPLSNKLADALLKIGYTYHELEDYTQAQSALNKVVGSFSGTSVARLAENRLNLLRREGKIN